MTHDILTPPMTWRDILKHEKEALYFKSILQALHDERQKGKRIYPPPKDIFNAFRVTEFHEVKIVILGQDPYHGPHQAHGLAFSVRSEIKPPPSLKNIYKELENDIEGFVAPAHGCLQRWAEQGVFLLNTVLSVEEGRAHSHASLGWERFTNYVLNALSEKREGLVFMLWGSHAQKRAEFIDAERHLILKSVHPSPLSAHRGFFGCRHFSKANHFLQKQGLEPIQWQL